jgi:hypothetical protein
MTLASSLNPSVFPDAVTFTATIDVTAPGAGAPTGTVQFFDNAVSIAGCGARPVTGGTATCTVSGSLVGSHPITATYSGDVNFIGSAAPVLTQVVAIGGSVASISPIAACESSAGFTLVVNGADFRNGYTVLWGSTELPTTFVGAGTLHASVTTSDLATPGSITVTVVDSGDNILPSPQSFTVTPDLTEPVVTAPAAIVIVQSGMFGPIRGTNVNQQLSVLGDTSLQSFLTSATVSDECSTPMALGAFLGGVPVDNDTVFPVGDSAIEFRFQDGAGNIGSATQVVTTWALGAFTDPDGEPAALDLLLLANLLARNLEAGTVAFPAPRVAADLDQDGDVQAVDLVILANKLVGNIATLPYQP